MKIITLTILTLFLLTGQQIGRAQMIHQATTGKQTTAGAVGSWEFQSGQVVLRLILNANSTGSLNGQAVTWQLNQGVMTMNDGSSTMRYNANLTADSLTLTGANLQQSLTFHRAGGSKEEAFAPTDEASPLGSWQREASGKTHDMVFQEDGTGVVDGIAFHWKFNQGVLILTAGSETLRYSASFAEGSMTLSGGNLGQPVTWKRIDEEEVAKLKPNTENKSVQGKGLVGNWQGPDGLVQINANNTMIIGGANYVYKVQGNIVTITGNDGSIQIPFQLQGDTLTVTVNGQAQTLRRASEPSPQSGQSGSNPQELVGKWCYISSSNTYGGSRMSNVCVTLYANGTFEYYGETSTSVQAGSSASQQSDSGTWSATGTTLTAHARKNGTITYNLQKMNHPKTGDAMLVLNGQWFVTTTQRPPWR